MTKEQRASKAQDVIIIDEEAVRIPDGQYEVRLTDWQTRKIFQASKLYLNFSIVTPGPHFGKHIYRYFNVTIVGKPGRRGAFKAGLKSDFLRLFADILGWSGRPDRIPMSKLEDNVLVVQTRTVTRGSRQEALPEPCQYSVVDKVMAAHKAWVSP